MMKGRALKRCGGIFESQPNAFGKAYTRSVLYTCKVLKKPNTSVPKIADTVFQPAKITRAMAIQP